MLIPMRTCTVHALCNLARRRRRVTCIRSASAVNWSGPIRSRGPSLSSLNCCFRPTVQPAPLQSSFFPLCTISPPVQNTPPVYHCDCLQLACAAQNIPHRLLYVIAIPLFLKLAWPRRHYRGWRCLRSANGALSHTVNQAAMKIWPNQSSRHICPRSAQLPPADQTGSALRHHKSNIAMGSLRLEQDQRQIRDGLYHSANSIESRTRI
jgi:hypothetical protein